MLGATLNSDKPMTAIFMLLFKSAINQLDQVLTLLHT